MISRDDPEILTQAYLAAQKIVAKPLIQAPDQPLGKWIYQGAKRVLDFVAALILLFLLFPLFLVISVAIVMRDGMPILFKHERVGKDGRRFNVLKFRTMRNDAEQFLAQNPELMREFRESFKLEKDPRITPLGNWLRSCSLDELPQLLNVLAGEMSLVGPRPIVEAELEKYGEFAPIYLSLKPGCAGLWQCSGRSDTSYDERVLIDVEYSAKASVAYDVSIFFWTVWAVLKRRGAR